MVQRLEAMLRNVGVELEITLFYTNLWLSWQPSADFKCRRSQRAWLKFGFRLEGLMIISRLYPFHVMTWRQGISKLEVTLTEV